MTTADTPFGQLKLSEVSGWLARRDKTPRAVAGAFSRAWWRWQHKYVQPKRAGIAPMFQIIAASMVFFYTINYGKLREYSRMTTCGCIPTLTLDVFTSAHREPPQLQAPLDADDDGRARRRPIPVFVIPDRGRSVI